MERLGACGNLALMTAICIAVFALFTTTKPAPAQEVIPLPRPRLEIVVDIPPQYHGRWSWTDWVYWRRTRAAIS
jgi:hypothetical protein